LAKTWTQEEQLKWIDENLKKKKPAQQNNSPTKYRDKYKLWNDNPEYFINKYGKKTYGRYIKYYATKAAIENSGIDQNLIAPTYKNLDAYIENESYYRKKYGDKNYESGWSKYYNIAKNDIDRIGKAVKLKQSGYNADILNYLPEGTVLNYSDDEEDQLRQVMKLAPKSFDAKAIHSEAEKIRKALAEENGDVYSYTNPYASLFSDAALTEEQLKKDLEIINWRYKLTSPAQLQARREADESVKASGILESHGDAGLAYTLPKPIIQESPEAHASPRLWLMSQKGEFGEPIGGAATPEKIEQVKQQFQIGQTAQRPQAVQPGTTELYEQATPQQLGLLYSTPEEYDAAIKRLQDEVTVLETQENAALNDALNPSATYEGETIDTKELTNNLADVKKQLADKKAELQELIYQKTDLPKFKELQGLVQAAITDPNYQTMVQKGGEVKDLDILGGAQKYLLAYLNNPEIQGMGTVSAMAGGRDDPYSKYRQLAPEEADILRYYYAKEDSHAIERYLTLIDPLLNSRTRAYSTDLREEQLEKMGTAGDIYAGMASVALTVPAMAGLTEAGYNAIFRPNERPDPNTPIQQIVGMKNETREFALRNTEGIGKWVGNAGFSLADMAAAASTGNPTVAAGILAGNAGAQAAYDVYQRGGSHQQAFGQGVAIAAIELVTEKVSIGNLFKTVQAGKAINLFTKEGALEFVKGMAKQSGIEFSEEFLAELGGNLADMAIMGDKSNFEAYKQQLIAQGMKPEEAQRAAEFDILVQAWEAGKMGAFTGMLTGSGANIISTMRTNYIQTGKTKLTKQEQIQKILEPLESNPDIDEASDTNWRPSPASRQTQAGTTQQQQGESIYTPFPAPKTPSTAPKASPTRGTQTKMAAQSNQISGTETAYQGKNFRISPESLPVNIKNAMKTAKNITPVSKIITDLSTALDVPVTTSRMKRSLKTIAQGYYDVHPEVIVSRQSNDIQTVIHEIGHHLDKKYKFSSTDPAKLQNILTKMPDEFKKAYSAGELNGEAVAEFLKHYIINPGKAKQLDADFYDLFEKTVSKEDMAAIKDAQKKTIEWYNADIWKRAGTTIQSYSEKPKQTFTDAYRKAKTFLVDEFQQLGVFDRAAKEKGYKGDVSVERVARNSKYASDVAQFIVEDYMAKPNGEIVTGSNGKKVNGLLKIIKGLSTKDFDNLSIYMKNKHALDWDMQGKRVFSDDFDLKEIQNAVDNFEAVNPELVKKAEEIYKWWGSFIEEWYVNTGLLSKDTYNLWKQKYPHYVPNYRVSERQTVSNGVNRGFSGQQSHIKAAKGSFKNTYNPIESLMRDTGRIVNIVKRAQVFRAIDKVAKSTEGLGDFVRRVDRDLVYQKFDTTDIKEKITDKFNKMLTDPKAATDIMDEVLDDTLENFIPKKFTNDTSIFSGIDENGKTIWYEVMDPMFIEALHGLETEKLPVVLNAVAKFNRGLKRAITGSNPFFSIASNLWRDLGEAFVFGSRANPIKFIGEQVKAYKDIITKSDAYMRFKAMGGTGDYVGTVNRPDTLLKTINETMKKPSIIDIPKKMFNAMEKLNNAIEASTRLAEFKRTQAAELKKGADVSIANEKAMRAGMEVTVDFRIKGKSSATLDSIFLFYNAGMQGTYKFTRAIGGALSGGHEAKRRLWGLLGKSVIAFALTQIGLDIWNYSEAPEKRALLPKYITDNYYVLYVGGKSEFVRIPKAQTLFNSVLGGASERVFSSLVNGQDLAIDSFFTGLVDDANPLQSNVFSPIIDVAANKTWYGTPIVSARLSKLPESLQYDAKTSEISKFIGQTFNISPKKVEYLIKQYSGGVGQAALPITTGDEGIGNFLEMLTRRMTVNPAFTNDVVDGYYDNVDWMEKLIAGYKTDGSITGKGGITPEQAKKLYETADTLLNGKILKRDKNGDVSKRGDSVLKDGKKQIEELWKEEQAAKTEEEKIKIRYKIINLCGVLNSEIENYKEIYRTNKEDSKIPAAPKFK
jgi:hypothetical protein